MTTGALLNMFESATVQRYAILGKVVFRSGFGVFITACPVQR